MKIIFRYDKFGGIFHKHLVDNLQKIINETGAYIVISSSWRSDGTMKEMWEHRGLPGEIIGLTPFCKSRSRGEEIQMWIDKNKKDLDLESYCILDDDIEDIFPSQLYNYVKTSGNKDHSDRIDIGYGLTLKCAEKASDFLLDLRILNK
jgi:hypothetical protein